MIRAALFDVYGTCVDWRAGVASFAGTMLAARGLPMLLGFRIADEWRALYQPAMEEIRAGRRDYVSLDVLQRENLDLVLRKLHLESEFTDDDRDVLNQAWDRLPAWPDTVDALSALASAIPVAACSNGSEAMMARLSRHAMLDWHMICGADCARNFKPEPEVYIRSCEKLGMELAQTVMVACHPDDLDAAAQAGLKTAYFPRPSEHGKPADFAADENANRFDFSAEALGALTARIIGAAHF
jgi:2-haloacid dehalogenase